jgi:hypothetical protein
VTVNSDFHNRQSTDLQPIAVSDGFHCSDLLTRLGAVDPTVLSVQKLAVAYMTKWIKEWQVNHPDALKGGSGVTVIDPATVQGPPTFTPAFSLPLNPSPITVAANVTTPTKSPAPINKKAKKILQNSFDFGN